MCSDKGLFAKSATLQPPRQGEFRILGNHCEFFCEPRSDISMFTEQLSVISQSSITDPPGHPVVFPMSNIHSVDWASYR